MCRDSFGVKFTKPNIENMIKSTNTYYGGLDLDVENVVFVYGSNDPWHRLGLQTELNEKSPLYIINGKTSQRNGLQCMDVFNKFVF